MYKMKNFLFFSFFAMCPHKKKLSPHLGHSDKFSLGPTLYLIIYLYYIDIYTGKNRQNTFRILNTEYFCVINTTKRKRKTRQSYRTLIRQSYNIH